MIENKKAYNRRWQRMDVQRPEMWSTWGTIQDFKGSKNLELGPGKYPRIPVEDGFFIDVSEEAITSLKNLGARALVANAENLPFEDDFFDLVVATEVLEHMANDKRAFVETRRVLKPSGFFLFSVPLKEELFGRFDILAGHQRRYEIKELLAILQENQFKIIKYRSQSFYFKILCLWTKFLGIERLEKKISTSQRSMDYFHLPKFLVNWLCQGWALFDKFRSPVWHGNIEALTNYDGQWIMLFCQKI